jgi:Endonuclease/Exonuclease/phosphatase family
LWATNVHFLIILFTFGSNFVKFKKSLKSIKMRIKKSISLLLLFIAIIGNAQNKKFAIHTVAFYNFENLFDTINQANNDEEWLPAGTQRWTTKKYKQKLENLSRVLSEIGTNEQQKESPTFIGGCEIENRGVLEDLVNQKKHFQPTSYINIPLIIFKNQENTKTKKEEDEKTDDVTATAATDPRVYTRDQLLVTGLLDGEEVNIIVNHWPSRSGGEKKSSPFREAAGALNRKIIDSLQKINPNAKIITMGDLNDGTYNKSVKQALGAKLKKTEVPKFGIYNPFEQMAKDGMGTIAYRDAWDIFDQIMVDEELIKTDYSSFRYWKAGIFNKPYLIQTTGQYKGYPLRHQANEEGFSDHFAVYIYLIKEVK